MRRINAIVAIATVTMAMCLFHCQAKQEEAIPVNDEGEGSQCDRDQKVASVCLACSTLPFNFDMDLVSCCSDESAFQFCNACINDEESCAKLLEEMATLENFSETGDDYNDDTNDVSYDDYFNNDAYDVDGNFADVNGLTDDREKRFGTLFIKKPKHYGRFLFGKRSEKRATDKRFGRLYMGSGSYFGKRTSESYPGLEKRFGTLHMGGSRLFGKRGTHDSMAMADNLGRDTQRDYAYFGDDADINKRFGRLFIGRKGLFGKRSAFEDKSVDVDKRFGRLFMGRRRGSLFG